jgi:hypothetical protein
MVRSYPRDAINIVLKQNVVEILSAFHHPYFADERSEIQMAMAQSIKRWFDGLGNNRNETLSRLSKANGNVLVQCFG